MANWDEKMEAAEKIREVIDEESNPMEIYCNLKRIIEIEQGLGMFHGSVNKEDTLEDHYNIDDVEVNVSKGSKANEKIDRYLDELLETIEKVGDRYVDVMEDWIECVKSEEYIQNEKEKIYELIEDKKNRELAVGEEMKKYKRKLPKMWAIYKLIKEDRDGDADGEDMHRLDEYLSEMMNTINERYDYDSFFR